MSSVNTINKFIESKNDEKLIINKVTDEIGFFYINIIRSQCSVNNIRFFHVEGPDINETNDLFEHKKIGALYSSSNKIIESILKKQFKIVIISDYKMFKVFSKELLSINGYNYEEDIKLYLENNLGINNLDILEFCISNPQLAIAEISKFQINSDGYLKESKVNKKKNYVLELRTEFFKLKRNDFDLKKLYLNLKTEVKYKKFSFLTY